MTRPIDEIKDAYDFRETLIPKAECSLGAAPLWHGWALAECYWAGMEREREKLKAEVARLERERDEARAIARRLYEWMRGMFRVPDSEADAEFVANAPWLEDE